MLQPEKIRELRHEYAQLRRNIYDRNRRLNEAGYKTRETPKVKDVEPGKLKSEINKARKWLESDKATVRGNRAIDKARAEQREYREREKAERKAREREQREKERPPRKTDEEKRQLKNQRERERYHRRKAEKESINKGIDELAKESPKYAQQLRNALSGLNRYGVKIRSLEELKAWTKYLDERKNNKDVKGIEYSSDRDIDDVLDELGDRNNHINVDDLNALINGFESWKSDLEGMYEAFGNALDNADFGADTFRAYMNSR